MSRERKVHSAVTGGSRRISVERFQLFMTEMGKDGETFFHGALKGKANRYSLLSPSASDMGSEVECWLNKGVSLKGWPCGL